MMMKDENVLKYQKRLDKLMKNACSNDENNKYMMMKIYPDDCPDYIDEVKIVVCNEKEYYDLEFIDEDSELYYLHSNRGAYCHKLYYCYIRNKYYLLIVSRTLNSNVLEDVTNKYDWERVFETNTLNDEYIVEGYCENIIKYKETKTYRHYKGSEYYDKEYKPTITKVEKNNENVEKMKNMLKRSIIISDTRTRLLDEELGMYYEISSFCTSKLIRLSDVS